MAIAPENADTAERTGRQATRNVIDIHSRWRHKTFKGAYLIADFEATTIFAGGAFIVILYLSDRNTNIILNTYLGITERNKKSKIYLLQSEIVPVTRIGDGREARRRSGTAYMKFTSPATDT